MKASGGFSLVELLVVITVIGILTTLAVTAYRGVREKTRLSVAKSRVDRLNGAVSKFNQVFWDFTVPAQGGSGADEILVLRSLQWRDEANPLEGTPFMRNDWDPGISNDPTHYRVRWNGRAYRVLEPGDNGTGMHIRFDNTDLNKTIDFGDTFKPVGTPGA